MGDRSWLLLTSRGIAFTPPAMHSYPLSEFTCFEWYAFLFIRNGLFQR